MRQRLLNLLFDVYVHLNDSRRERGQPPGVALEVDIERLAGKHWLVTERRTRRGPLGSAYYSGLSPETDLFAYAKPEFVQAEIKDLSSTVGRTVVTDLFARAMDIHLGRAYDGDPDAAWDHYAVLIAAGGADDVMRAACLRLGICLIEPQLVPLPVLGRSLMVRDPLLIEAGCPQRDLRIACLPFSRRFPCNRGAVCLDASALHSNRIVGALLRFQELGTRLMPRPHAGK
jgi:hypothetical protein